MKGKEILSVRFPFLSYYRSTVTVATCCAIYQVDLPHLFPRHCLKAEDYGWALMDVGVSSTMFILSMTNRLIITHPTTKRSKGLLREVISSITSNSALMFAASVRFFMLGVIDYHDHVTEWGTHWNFFVTIAILNVAIVFIRSSEYTMIYGFVLMIANELF